MPAAVGAEHTIAVIVLFEGSLQFHMKIYILICSKHLCRCFKPTECDASEL